MVTIEYRYTICNDQIRVTNIPNECLDMGGLTILPRVISNSCAQGILLCLLPQCSHNNLPIIPLSHVFISFSKKVKELALNAESLVPELSFSVEAPKEEIDVQDPCFWSPLQCSRGLKKLKEKRENKEPSIVRLPRQG